VTFIVIAPVANQYSIGATPVKHIVTTRGLVVPTVIAAATTPGSVIYNGEVTQPDLAIPVGVTMLMQPCSVVPQVIQVVTTPDIVIPLVMLWTRCLALRRRCRSVQ